MKEDLSKERDEHLTEIVKLRELLTDSQNRQVALEEKETEATMKIQEVCDTATAYAFSVLW